METRANYVLIGVFTLLAIVGGLGFLVWLARFEVNRQYDYYDVIFDNVSGLSRASDVRFNGLTVGQVTAIDLSEEHRGKVRARIEVTGGTPITEDTTAQLAAQGVTGVSYVSLTSGRDDAALLRPESGKVPEIIARRSVVEALTEDAPDLVNEAITLVKSLQSFIGPDNQAHVSGILANLDQASGQLQSALDDFASITRTVSTAAGQIGGFTGRLDGIGATLETTLANADEALAAARTTLAGLDTTLGAADGTLKSATATFDGANAVIRDRLPGIVADLAETVAALRAAVAEISGDASSVLGSFGGTADAATARLEQLETTLAGLDATLAEATATFQSVDAASKSVETLVAGDGTALVSDARATLADARTSLEALDRVIADDVPGIVAEIRTAVDTANRVIDETGADITAFTDGLAPLTATAGTTLDAATADAARRQRHAQAARRGDGHRRADAGGRRGHLHRARNG